MLPASDALLPAVLILMLPVMFTPIGPSILLVALFVGFLAALGRSSIPVPERRPWTRWSAKDLAGNVVLGARLLTELHERDPRTPPLEDRNPDRGR